MTPTMLFGVVIVVIAGLMQGSGGWPIKVMRKFQFEHWAFIAMLVGLIVIPWAVTLLFCPHAMEAYHSVGWEVLLKSNLFSLSWGVANILCMLCFVRIGFSLTGGILTGIGVSLGVTVPMIFKGTGLPGRGGRPVARRPDDPGGGGRHVGRSALGLVGRIWTRQSLAEIPDNLRQLFRRSAHGRGGRRLSCGISFAFVYSQGPIVAAMTSRGAAEMAANFAVWAVGLLAGARQRLLSRLPDEQAPFVARPEKLRTRMRSGNRDQRQSERWHRPDGARHVVARYAGRSIGFGVQQAMQMLGSQAVGFIGGEWQQRVRPAATRHVCRHRRVDSSGLDHGLRQSCQQPVSDFRSVLRKGTRYEAKAHGCVGQGGNLGHPATSASGHFWFASVQPERECP